MNKAELVSAIAEKASISKAASKNAVDAFIETLSESLSKGDKVTLVGFGTFSVVERAARVSRNPTTGEKLNVPAKKAVKFKSGAELSASVK